jgi:uncharacterized protein YjiS (DUF1127 family)
MSVFTLNYRPAVARTAPSLFKRAVASVKQTIVLHRTHSLLVQLDDRLLADVGLSRTEAGYPANHPIWDAGLR